jgi:hypothetical protein
MRGNFLKIVDKNAHDSVISFLNSKGKAIQLDYDVQAAVLEVFVELRVLEAEKKTLRAAIEGQMGKIKELEANPPPIQEISLPKFLAYAERTKKLWMP